MMLPSLPNSSEQKLLQTRICEIATRHGVSPMGFAWKWLGPAPPELRTFEVIVDCGAGFTLPIGCHDRDSQIEEFFAHVHEHAVKEFERLSRLLVSQRPVR